MIPTLRDPDARCLGLLFPCRGRKKRPRTAGFGLSGVFSVWHPVRLRQSRVRVLLLCGGQEFLGVARSVAAVTAVLFKLFQ